MTPYLRPNYSWRWHFSVGPANLHSDTFSLTPQVKHADSYHLWPSHSTWQHTSFPGPTIPDSDTFYFGPTSAGCKLRPIVNLCWPFVTAYLGPWAPSSTAGPPSSSTTHHQHQQQQPHHHTMMMATTATTVHWPLPPLGIGRGMGNPPWVVGMGTGGYGWGLAFSYPCCILYPPSQYPQYPWVPMT